MESFPRISVITPSFNQASYLEETICSVLGQNYPNLEYIVIDGGSGDGSKEILERYSHHLSYWCSEPDRGLAHAIQKGAERCTGDIICWVASDDCFLPGALHRVSEYFHAHPDEEVVTGGCYFVDSKGTPCSIGLQRYTMGVPATFERFLFYEQDGVAAYSTFWKREAFESVGGVDPDLQFAMDFDLFIRLARRRPFGHLPEFLSSFRVHSESKSTTSQHVRESEVAMIKARYGLGDHHPVVQKAAYWRYRIPSLVRKSFLALNLLTGRVNLKALAKDQQNAYTQNRATGVEIG